MAAIPVSFFVDTPQQRLIEDAISTLVTGCDWDPATISNVLIEPASLRAMLLPGVLDGNNWATSTTGIYSKFVLSDYVSLTDPTNWEEHSPDAGGPFIRYKVDNAGGVSGGVPMAAINTPIVLEYYAGQDTNTSRGNFEFGWGSTASFGGDPGDVGFRNFDEGKVEVWKSGLKVGEGSISAKKEYLDAILGNQAQNAKSRFVTLLLIPFSDREILIASTQGGAFVHVFEDLLEGVSGQTIVPSGYFWFNVPAPVSAQGIRIAKLQYVESGTVYGRPSSYRLPTPGGQTVQKKIFQSATEGALGLVALSSMTPVWTPYTTTAQKNAVQLKFDLTRGSGGQSPFLYGGRAWYDPQVDSTPDTQVDLVAEGHVQKLSLEFGDVCGGHRIQVSMTRPEGIDASGIPAIMSQVNRPIAVASGAESIFQGVMRPPQWEQRYSFLDNDSAQKISAECSSIWEFLEKFEFGDPIPLDGYSLGDAYRLVCKTVGLEDPIVSTDADAVLLGDTGAKHGTDGFNLVIEVGDTGATWIKRLHETFAANWFHGIDYASGQPKLKLLAPADLPSSSSVSLYPTVEAAYAAGIDGVDTMLDATKYVYTKHRRDWLEPEANDVWIMGLDFRTGRPILLNKRDAASIDPTIAAVSRPDNWLGMLVKYSWVDPALSSYDLADYAMSCIYPRVTTKRELHEFQSQRLRNVAQGDLVTLVAAGEAGENVVVRIKTLGADILGAIDPAADPRYEGAYNNEPAHYVGESGSLVCPLGVPGTTIKSIKENHRLKIFTKNTIMPETELSKIALKRPPFFVSDAT